MVARLQQAVLRLTRLRWTACKPFQQKSAALTLTTTLLEVEPGGRTTVYLCVQARHRQNLLAGQGRYQDGALLQAVHSG